MLVHHISHRNIMFRPSKDHILVRLTTSMKCFKCRNMSLMNCQCNPGLLICFKLHLLFPNLQKKKINNSSFITNHHHLRRLHLRHDLYHQAFNAHLATYRVSHYLKIDQNSFYFLSLFCQTKMYHIFWDQRLKTFLQRF